jgi:glucoamylase
MAGLLALYAQDYLPAINTTGLALPAMHALSSLIVLGTCAVQAVLGRPEAALHARRSLESFIGEETQVAWNKLLCNIGPSGCAASGVAAGAVVASPSKVNPDCE